METDYKGIYLNDFVKAIENKILIANDLYCDCLQENRIETAQKVANQYHFLCKLVGDIDRVYLGDKI